MKKVMKLSICMLVTMTSIAASYANDFSSYIDDKEKAEITLTLEDVKEGQQLLIKDVNGLILHRETIETTGVYNNTFDLTNLPNGNYYFEHQKAYQIKIIPFNVSSGKVAFTTAKQTTIYKPVLRVKDNNLLVSKLALDKEPLDVKIYYDGKFSSNGYELIHSDNISDEMNIERIYKLDKKEKGNYRIVFESNGREYIENVKI